tara:strand:- start:789 stop:1220 length:432 start_codon:yes stop_codon:yes gene_type:complete
MNNEILKFALNQEDEIIKTKKRPFKNGFEIVHKDHIIWAIKERTEEGPEQERVVSIIENLLADHDLIQWYCPETHDDTKPSFLPSNDWHTMYSSAYMSYPANGYNIIQVAFDGKDKFICLSTNGCEYASAPSEYIRLEGGLRA